MADSEPVHWDYEGDHGPAHWSELTENFSICNTGKNQSPIDLASILEAEMPKLDFNYQTLGHLLEENTGHAIQEVVQPGNMVRLQEKAYELKQFHFHSPSEHTVRGRHYPMEVHFVHQNEMGELLVVGLMFEVGRHNLLMDQLPSFRAARGEDPLAGSVDFNELVVGLDKYFLYNGSLTTPPCSEGVRWIVMQEPIEVSADQIQHFRDLLGFDNNRPIQPINARILLQ